MVNDLTLRYISGWAHGLNRFLDAEPSRKISDPKIQAASISGSTPKVIATRIGFEGEITFETFTRAVIDYLKNAFNRTFEDERLNIEAIMALIDIFRIQGGYESLHP